MAEEVNKKTNFFKILIRSIKDLDKYEDFALENPSQSFKYLFKLILLMVVIITACYTYQGITTTRKIYMELKEILPDFLYSDGMLEIDSEEPIVINNYEDSVGKIIIDVTADSEKIKEYESENETGLLFLNDRFTVLNVGQLSYKYSDILLQYEIEKTTKQEAIEKIDNINIISLAVSIYFILFVYIFISYFIKIFIDVILLAILTYFISILARMKIKSAPAFSIAIHSITLPIVLSLIEIILNIFIEFEIQYFNIMYYTISYIYVVVAILMIKTDFINRQIELNKIMKEQQKIKNETDKKEQQEDKKEEEKKEDKKENKKNKDKKEEEEEDSKDLGTDTPV